MRWTTSSSSRPSSRRWAPRSATHGSARARAEAVSAEDVLDAVLTEGVRAAQARAGLIALLSADGSTLEIVAARGYEERFLGPFRRVSIDAGIPLTEAVRRGEPVLISSRAERDRLFPDLATLDDPGTAAASLPLQVEGRTIG